MTEKSAHEQVIATAGNRSFLVPEAVPFFYFWAPDDHLVAELEGEVVIVDGRPQFRSMTIRANEPMTPLEVQRLPWGRFAEGALENAARTGEGERDPRAVYDARRRARRAESRQGDGGRQPVTPERLDEVLALKAEAQAAGQRWDTYAAKRLGFEPAYVRRLGARAERERG